MVKRNSDMKYRNNYILRAYTFFYVRIEKTKEVITMKKFKEFVLHHMKAPNILACLALAFAFIGANTLCCCVYHQPDKPNLKSLRKF